MEGFVFDLQRFAEYNDWPNILASNIAGGFFYRASLINNVCEMVDTSAGGASTGHYYVHVPKDGVGGTIYITNGSTRVTDSNWTMRLNFNNYSVDVGFPLNIGSGDYKYNAILTDLPGCSVYGQSGKTVEATIKSGKTVNFYDCGTLNLDTSQGSAEVHSNTEVNVLASATVNAVNLCADGDKILNVRADARVNSVEGTGTVNVANGAVVKIDGKSFTGSKADGNSTLTVSNSGVTLTGGVFSYAGTDQLTLKSGAGVEYGDVTYTATAGDASSQCVKDANGLVTLSAGKFNIDTASNVKVGSFTYTTKGASTIAVGNNGAVLSSGEVTLDANESITVSDSTGNKTSAIAAGEDSSIDVTVTDGAYVISGLAGGETVSIDNVTYTYNATDKTLSKDGVGWKLKNNSIRFTINAGTDTFDTEYGIAVVPDMKTELNAIMGNMQNAGTLYFNAAGLQQASDSGAAYTLERDGSGKYTLTSNASATTALTVDLANVDGSNLTINFGTDGETAQNVKLDADTTLAGLTLGAGDSVLGSNGNALATAGNASGTVTVANGKVTALTKGTFVGVGTTDYNYNIAVAAESTVNVDGVTFNAGAAGKFTNGETAADDTFEVTSGTATIDADFNGSTVTANGVTYTVEPLNDNRPVATFYGDANTVTGFTAGKITLTAANETIYNIGNQTIKDGNGAALTFVPTGLCSTGTGSISLGAEESITVSDESCTYTKQIAAGDGSTIDVAVTNGKYTLSGLDNEEKVTIGDKTYLYHGNTGFLEEMSGSEGTGRGYRLKTSGNNATIAFTTAGVLDTDTAIALPDTMAGDAGQFAAVCSVLEVGQTFKLKADGSRALGNDTVAYELTKTANGYTLTSTNNANSDITLDASGLTGLTVDLTAGNGTQTLKVDNATTLSSDSKLGTGDKITDGTNTLLTANAATTLSVAAGPDISVAPGANVTVPATPGIKTAGNGTYTVNGISVTTSGDSSEPFISIIPDTGASDTTGLTLQGIAESETFTANTPGKNYTVGDQTFQNVSADVEINGAGTATLTGEQSVTVGTNNTTIQNVAGSGNGVQVTLTDGKYTLSGLDDGERVSIGGKTYLYRKETQFLEEYNNSYPEGSGDGYILTNDGSITLNSDGTPADNTARTMPASLAEDGALEIICKAVPEGTTQKYSFDKDGKRANPPESAAYTLEKKDDGSYVLVSTDSCTGELPIDARGLTNLTVDFSKGTGKQTLTVDENTELATGSEFGAGDVITYANNDTYVTCGSGTTSVSLTPGKPLTIGSMTNGTSVSVKPGKSVNVGNSIYTAAGTNDLVLAKAADDESTIGVKSGTLSATSGTYTMLDNNGNKGDVVTVSGNAEVSTDGTTGKATVKGLDSVGEKAVITDSNGKKTTFEVIAQNIVKKVDKDGNTTYLKVTAEDPVFKEEGDTGVTAIDGAPVSPKDAEDGTTIYNADGKRLPSGSEGAAILTKNGNSSTLEVRQDMVLGVQLDEGTVTVKDKGTDTTYTVNGTEISASGATFTSAGGVVSDVTGTLTVKKGALDTKDGSADARYTLNDGTEVNFQEGSPLSGTKVTTFAGNTITIEENNNNNPTTVDSEGNITGVDSGAEIKGVPDGATVTTTGNGSLALNGKTWEVRGDSDGATFTASSDSISGVTGLAEGATLSTTDNVSGLTLNGCTIASARNGISYTAGSAEGSGEFTLANQGDSIKLENGTTFTVGKNQNGVSIGTDGKVSGLTDGEKVTAVIGSETYTYEVSGGTLVTTKVSADGAVTTMTSILPAGETAFSIVAGHMEAANGSTDASKLKENTDINAGSTEVSPVNTVTNGMLLDKKGHATADRDKAIAEITIKDDGALKYEATQEVRQTIRIGAGSAAEWEITTTNKADTIEYAGSHDVSITSRDGNDKITISGAGDAVVRGESGKNTITHTGTGDATIIGGSGNDTIKSTHAGDEITGGAGENTFILTSVETHVSDFAYGQDKAVVTSKAGPLDITKIKATPDGTISYAGAGNTGGSLNVAGQGYGSFYAANLTDANGKNNVNVGWTGVKGGMIDASSLTDKVLLLGNSNGASDSLIGGQSRDTLVAGNGASSLWGGAGSDLIESNSDASHTIFFLKGDGNDTVTGFTPYGDTSSDNPDTLNFLGQDLTEVKNTSQGLLLRHGSDNMLLSGKYTANTMFKWESGEASGIAKIGKENTKNNFTYDAEVTNYLGSAAVDTLTISSDEPYVEIWMDGSQGKSYDSVEILDAGSANGKAILAGGAGANTITGGNGNSSLWGGSDGANDLLKGGRGEDVFYYGQNEGNDVINNASAEDKVMLYNLGLSDLKGAEISSNKIIITQSSGQTLTINGRVGEITLSDGSTWTADYSSKTWSRVR